MKNMTISNISGTIDAKIQGAASLLNAEIAGAVIDSRLVEKDFLFFATKGEKVDGHDFIKTAFEKGALAVVCERVPEGINGNFLVVKDSLKALREVAEFYRKQLSIKVVGISGSVGKTSTKEFIAGVLAQKYKVLKTEMNFNNEIGVPLSVLKIREEHEIAVLEMGISDFGEMSRLAAITRPDICVLTNIGQSHLEKLIDRDGIRRAKTEMFDFMQPDGTAILFGDDDKLAELTTVNGKASCFYGTKDNADIKATHIVNRGLLGSTVTIQTNQGEMEVQVKLPGKHMVYNALAATAVGLMCGLSQKEICQGIEKVEAVAGRSRVIKQNTLTIIDDCYNANPASMKAAVDLLNEALSRKVAILGDMFELGTDEAELHKEVGAYAVEHTDVLVCIGKMSYHMFEAAVKTLQDKGRDLSNIYYFETKEKFLERYQSILKCGDAVLIKASHGMQFLQILQVLMEKDIDEMDETGGLALEEHKMEEQDTKQDVKQEDKHPVKEEMISETANTNVSDDAALEEDNKEAEVTKENRKREDDDKHSDTAEKETKEEKTEDKKVKKKSKKVLITVLAIAAVLLIAAGAIFFGIKKKESDKTAGILVFNKNNTLYAAPGNKVTEFTDSFQKEKDSDSKLFLSRLIKESHDGKYLFYPKDHDMDESGYSLFYNKMNGKPKNEELVDTNVYMYEVDNNNNVYYVKDGDLYCYIFKEETKTLIATGTDYFHLDKNTGKVVYSSEGAIYIHTPDAQAEDEIIAENATGVIDCSTDLSVIVYADGDTIYVLDHKKITKVMDEYHGVYIEDLDGNYSIYFLNVAEYPMSEFLKDDLKDSTKTNSYLTTLNNSSIDTTLYSLSCFHKGDKETKVLEPYVTNIGSVHGKTDFLIVKEVSLKKSQRLSTKKLFKNGKDEVTVLRDIESLLEENENYAIVRKGKTIKVKSDALGYGLCMVEEIPGKGVAVISMDETSTFSLHTIDYRWFAAGKTETLATDTMYIDGFYKKEVVFTKHSTDNKRNLYWGETLVCDDIVSESVKVSADGKLLMYISSEGNLNSFDGVSYKIYATDVCDYFPITTTNMWYLRLNEETGVYDSLYHYDGKDDSTSAPVETEIDNIEFLSDFNEDYRQKFTRPDVVY